MPDGPQSTLRLEPHMIPALRAAFETAMDDLSSMIRTFQTDGEIAEPWLGDPSSEAALVAYRAAYRGTSGSATESLLAYESELAAIRDTLTAMETTYRRTEGDNAALWGRQA